MEEAERLCDRVAIVDKGRLLAATVSSCWRRTAAAQRSSVAQTDRGEMRIETPDPLAELNRLAATGTVNSFHMERATLEQVFLRLTGRSLRD
jgi:ABC-2 type transport system ATP-binding protein